MLRIDGKVLHRHVLYRNVRAQARSVRRVELGKGLYRSSVRKARPDIDIRFPVERDIRSRKRNSRNGVAETSGNRVILHGKARIRDGKPPNQQIGLRPLRRFFRMRRIFRRRIRCGTLRGLLLREKRFDIVRVPEQIEVGRSAVDGNGIDDKALFLQVRLGNLDFQPFDAHGLFGIFRQEYAVERDVSPRHGREDVVRVSRKRKPDSELSRKVLEIQGRFQVRLYRRQGKSRKRDVQRKIPAFHRVVAFHVQSSAVREFKIHPERSLSVRKEDFGNAQRKIPNADMGVHLAVVIENVARKNRNLPNGNAERKSARFRSVRFHGSASRIRREPPENIRKIEKFPVLLYPRKGRIQAQFRKADVSGQEPQRIGIDVELPKRGERRRIVLFENGESLDGNGKAERVERDAFNLDAPADPFLRVIFDVALRNPRSEKTQGGKQSAEHRRANSGDSKSLHPSFRHFLRVNIEAIGQKIEKS